MKSSSLVSLFILMAGSAACSDANTGTTIGSDGGTDGATTAPEADASSTTAPEAGTTTDAATTPATTPVELKNLSYSPGSISSRVTITFALANHSTSPIDRVQEVTVRFSGQSVTFGVTCQNTAWIVGGSSSSTVITLNLDDYGSSSSMIVADQCSPVSGPTTLPWGAALSLEVKGLLQDATPWKTSASAMR